MSLTAVQAPMPAETLWSIALAGGKGTRLADGRKRLDRATHPHLPPEAWGTAGPKALASMRAGPAGPVKPMIEWHLDIHAACGRVERVILAAGSGGDLLRHHFHAAGGSYRGLPVELLIEERPAGTIAPIVKLHAAGRLPERPVVYANADNLLDADLYGCYRHGLERAAACGIDPGECVIDVAALVPWEESGDYGALDLDGSSGLVRGFREKAPKERNPFMERAGRRWTPINSGFSIIPNPRRLFVALPRRGDRAHLAGAGARRAGLRRPRRARSSTNRSTSGSPPTAAWSPYWPMATGPTWGPSRRSAPPRRACPALSFAQAS